MQSCLKRTAAMSSGPQLFRLKKKKYTDVYVYILYHLNIPCNVWGKEILNKKNSSPVILVKADVCIY